MKSYHVFSTALIAGLCVASESAFSVNDDLFAYPQYGVEFINSYVLQEDAAALLHSSFHGSVTKTTSAALPGDVSPLLNHETGGHDESHETTTTGTYERLILHGRPHLCFLPAVEPMMPNETVSEPSAADREKELEQAVSRGAQLLQGMTSNQCLYYSTGWWTYSFCHNAQITQFHALPPGTNGRVWPPQEDPTTPSYVLGKFEQQNTAGKPAQGQEGKGLSTEVQTKAETNYLVQRLEGGTACDLTGNDRKVEVQFHCNPQLTDRIGWIKETATCAYLMIIYTPRLCNDVAFQPPKESRAHPITCREIISEADADSWDRSHAGRGVRQTLEQGESQQIFLGNIEVGAMKYVGREGKRLERGRIVLTQDEKAETVVMQKDGQISSLSKAELKKLKLNPEDVDTFRKELQKLAGPKDWKIERLDDVNGRTQLRGVVSADDEEGEEVVQSRSEEEGEVGGSQEELYEEEG